MCYCHVKLLPHATAWVENYDCNGLHDPMPLNHGLHDPIPLNHGPHDPMPLNHGLHDPMPLNHGPHDPMPLNHGHHDPMPLNHGLHDPMHLLLLCLCYRCDPEPTPASAWRMSCTSITWKQPSWMSGCGLPSLTTSWCWWGGRGLMLVWTARNGCTALSTRLGVGGGCRIWASTGLMAAVLLLWAPTCTPLGVRVPVWRSLRA